MGESYIHFAIASVVFALIAWLDGRRKDGKPTGVAVVAALAAVVMSYFAYSGWNDRQACLQLPEYLQRQSDDC